MAVAQPHIFSGQGFSLQGDKGRFVLPPQFRKTVKDSSGGVKTLCIARHDRWTCLTGFGLSRVEEFPEVLERERKRAAEAGEPFDYDTRLMQLWGVFEIPFDGSGRFILPDYVATIANIDKEIYFHGSGEYFLLWNPDELAKAGPGLEAAQAACTALAAKERAKVKRS